MRLPIVKDQTFVKLPKIGCAYWFQWVLVTNIGFLISLYWIEVGERPDLLAVEGATGGAVIGLAQWLVLRQQFSQAWWWVVASIVTWVFISSNGLGALGWVAPRDMYYIPLRVSYGALEGAKVGVLLGITQWLFLRQQVLRASWWILASTIAWAIGLALAWAVGAFLRVTTGIFLGEVVGLALGWLVVASITGVALVWLLRDSDPDTASGEATGRGRYK